MSRKMRTFLIAGSAFFALIAAALFFGTRGMDEIMEYTIPKVDLNSIADGEYEGTLTKTRWALSVNVRVRNHMIENITITDKKSSNITEKLISSLEANLVNTRNPEFDAISGATMTSRGYVIAVANALTSK